MDAALKSKETYQQTAPSLADQWRRHLEAREQDPTKAVEIALPSGMTVKATRTNLLLLMRRGVIPDALLPRVEALIATAQSGGDDAVRVALNQRLAENPAAFQAEWINLLDTVWLATVVEPRFTESPTLSSIARGEFDLDTDAIPIDAVDENDKTFLFSWAQGVTESAASFLRRVGERTSPAVGTSPVGDDLQPGPAGALGDRYEG